MCSQRQPDLQLLITEEVTEAEVTYHLAKRNKAPSLSDGTVFPEMLNPQAAHHPTHGLQYPHSCSK